MDLKSKITEEDLRLKEYFKRIYTRRNELFVGEARQEMIESLQNIDSKQIITFHEAFEFFAEEYDLEIAAVNVVLPWSTCPIVPILTCSFERSNFSLAI